MMKNYPGLTMDYVLYEMSYENLIMYNSVIPSHDSKANTEEDTAEKQAPITTKKGLNFGGFISQMKNLRKDE